MERITPAAAVQAVWAADIPVQDKPPLVGLAWKLTEEEKLSLPLAGDPMTPTRAVELLKDILREREKQSGVWLYLGMRGCWVVCTDIGKPAGRSAPESC
jgi:hypothetical protein